MVPVSFCGSIHNVVHLGVELFGFYINLYNKHTHTSCYMVHYFIVLSASKLCRKSGQSHFGFITFITVALNMNKDMMIASMVLIK